MKFQVVFIFKIMNPMNSLMIDNIDVKLKTTVTLLGSEVDNRLSSSMLMHDAKKQTLKPTH